MQRPVLTLVLVSAFVACGKEEWNQSQLGVANPYADTDETEPAADDPVEDATTDAASTPGDAGGESNDARPSDARADARDATSG